ncbi:hypothetical protein GOV03_05000 [Candidatus Woesearchaeota archaeon]|nr:hypothetical protein [Candidatus Woesearchaeota archaeon]
MEKVIVFDSYAALERKNSWVNRYLQKNLRILETFEELIREKITGEEKSGRLDSILGNLTPEEKRAFRKQYPNLGEGLVLNCLTSLLVDESKKNREYWFKMDGLDYGILIDANHGQINGLIQGIAGKMVELSEYYLRMRIDPVFYTVLEKQEGGKITKTMDDTLENDKAVELLERKFNIPDLRENQEMLMVRITEGFPVTRGLTEEEREEFEALFFN